MIDEGRTRYVLQTQQWPEKHQPFGQQEIDLESLKFVPKKISRRLIPSRREVLISYTLAVENSRTKREFRIIIVHRLNLKTPIAKCLFLKRH